MTALARQICSILHYSEIDNTTRNSYGAMRRILYARQVHLTHDGKIPDRPCACHAGAMRPTLYSWLPMTAIVRQIYNISH